MVDLLVALPADATKKSLMAVRREQASFAFAALVDILCAAIEVSKSGELWKQFAHTRLHRRQAVKRKRRASPAFKIAATKTVAIAKRIRSVTQLMNANAIFEEGELQAVNKSSLDFAYAERFNYVLSSLRAFEGTTSLGVVCDGATMGSDDLLAVNLTSGEQKVGCFGPPLVPW